MLRRLVFLAVFVAPLACAAGEAVRAPAAWQSWREADRVLALLANTAALAAAAMAVAVPLGVLLGVAVERVALPGRRLLRAALLLGLFVPLPVYAVAWQVVLGSWLPPLSLQPGQVAWRPWKQGLLPAAWVHAMAATPWVAWIVAASLRHADPALEDEATMAGGPRRLLRGVLLPRVALAAAAGAGFVAVQTATEIAVTDAMMVRTFAEEVYTQLVSYPAGVAAAVAVTVPVWVVAGLAATAVARPLAARFFPPEATGQPGRTIEPPGALTAGVWLVVGFTAVLPLAALVWKAGLTASGWGVGNLATQLDRTVTLSGVVVAQGVLAAALAGAVTAALAAWFCWANRDRPAVVVGFAVLLALTPGPLVGLGLKELISQLLTLEENLLRTLGVVLDFPPVRSALYDQPSPLPGVWACVVRFFPVAVAVLFPVVRSIPKELHEAARLDGVSAWRFVGWPLVRNAVAVAAVAVGVLGLGEVSASKLVVPPHLSVYVLDLFNQMHYGAEATVAAMALVQVAVTAAVVFASGVFSVSSSPAFAGTMSPSVPTPG